MVLPSGARPHAELAQDDLERAPARERALQQVGADEGGERQPPGADEQRAGGQAEGERRQDERPATMRTICQVVMR